MEWGQGHGPARASAGQDSQALWHRAEQHSAPPLLFGYLAGVLSGVCLGQLVTVGGCRPGFQVMAVLTAATAILSLFLYPRPARSGNVGSATLQPSIELE
jgi:hypothetical protein